MSSRLLFYRLSPPPRGTGLACPSASTDATSGLWASWQKTKRRSEPRPAVPERLNHSMALASPSGNVTRIASAACQINFTASKHTHTSFVHELFWLRSHARFRVTELSALFRSCPRLLSAPLLSKFGRACVFQGGRRSHTPCSAKVCSPYATWRPWLSTIAMRATL